MIRDKEMLLQLHERYIKGTLKDAIVQDVQTFICPITYVVKNGAGFEAFKVYVSTRTIKHVYDKRAAQEYDFLISRLHKIIRYPHRVYLNKDGKRGDYCFIRKYGDSEYLCSLELKSDEPMKERMEVTTFFQIRKASYLNNYKILWNWEADTSLHRSTFDSGLRQPNDTPQ